LSPRHEQDRTGNSPEDTSAYLEAASQGGGSASPRVRRHFSSRPRRAGTTSNIANHDIDQYLDSATYRHRRMARQRRRGLRVAILSLVAILIIVGAAAAIYLSNINARLSSKVSQDLREQLVEVKPEETFYLLLLGVDKDQGRLQDSENYGTSETAYRSDSIMLCRIDPKNIKVTMVSIHRDTLVYLRGGKADKINASYSMGGPAYTTQVVSEFCDVPISHYAEVDLDRFISIVDVVGGVTVDLPVPVYDPEYTGLDLPAGIQTLNGEEAALLCRCRHGYDKYGDGDRYRAANQRMVFTEIIKKVLQSDPATMASTITTMADSVTTDLDLVQILDLATQMSSLNVETDIMTGMEPTEGVFYNETWYEICLKDQWRKMMMRVYQGLPPYDESDGEYDSTAGVAGGVGEEGERAAEAAGTPEVIETPEEDYEEETYDDSYYDDSDDYGYGYNSYGYNSYGYNTYGYNSYGY